MNYDNYDEEINEFHNEHDIYQEMNMKEIEDVSDIKNKEIDENEILNNHLSMKKQKNYDYNNLNYEQNSFKYSLYKELEDKWSDIEKRKQLNLKRRNYNDYKEKNITIDYLLNWKGIVYESRKKFNERKLKQNENNEFDTFIKEKIKELKNLNTSNLNKKENPKDKIRNYFNKKGFNNYYNFDSLQKLTSNNLNNSNLKKSFLKEDEEEELINNKHIFFKITEDKIPLIKEKESRIKNKLRNLFGIITKDNKYIINNNIGDSKFSEMSIDDLDKNFEDIISDLSNDYKIKSKNLIFKRNKKHNLNKSYSINGRRFNSRNNIKKKFLENNILLNELLPESGIGNKKINSFNNNNNKLSFSRSRIIKDYNQLNRNQSYKIFKTNKYNSIINKFAGITSPKLSKLIH